MNKDEQPREELYTKGEIRTFTGKYINVFDPNPDDIVIDDIAHALSNMPRFGGHLPVFYSVARHSIMCAGYVLGKELQLEALMHDASEAYLLDIPSPIKEMLPDYKRVEKNLQRVICEKFDLPYPMSKEVKDVDRFMLDLEWRTLVLGQRDKPKIYSNDDTKEMFLGLFRILSRK